MRFGVSDDGKLATGDDRWAWHTYKTETGECRFQLYLPDTDEQNRVVTRFRVGDRRMDASGWREFVAAHWMRDWEGVKSVRGVELEANAKNRATVLKSDRNLWEWVHEKFREGAEAVDAGKDGGATD